MESTSTANRIQVSTALYQTLANPRAFHLEFRGDVEVKGKGSMATWWLSGKGDHDSSAPRASMAHAKAVPTPRGSMSIANNAETTGCPFSRRRSAVAERLSKLTSVKEKRASTGRGVSLDDAASDTSEGYASGGQSTGVAATRPALKRRTAAAAAAVHRPVAVTAALPEVFDVHVLRASCNVTLSFVPGSMTLEEIIQSAVPESSSKTQYVKLFGSGAAAAMRRAAMRRAAMRRS